MFYVFICFGNSVINVSFMARNGHIHGHFMAYCQSQALLLTGEFLM